jgi:hypothetical protein
MTDTIDKTRKSIIVANLIYSLEIICVDVLLKRAIEFSHSIPPSETETDYYGNICKSKYIISILTNFIS